MKIPRRAWLAPPTLWRGWFGFVFRIRFLNLSLLRVRFGWPLRAFLAKIFMGAIMEFLENKNSTENHKSNLGGGRNRSRRRQNRSAWCGRLRSLEPLQMATGRERQYVLRSGFNWRQNGFNAPSGFVRRGATASQRVSSQRADLRPQKSRWPGQSAEQSSFVYAQPEQPESSQATRLRLKAQRCLFIRPA